MKSIFLRHPSMDSIPIYIKEENLVTHHHDTLKTI